MIDCLGDMNAKKAAGGYFHAVRFYDNEAALCGVVTAFLREGLALGQPGLVIGTAGHRAGILAELRARELDIDALQKSRDLVVLDAAETMSTFMVDGTPNGDRFSETMKE